ncbi:MAG TPA: hypothetical protein V6C57_16175 [Coleofasciculaceae cyanobacterium]
MLTSSYRSKIGVICLVLLGGTLTGYRPFQGRERQVLDPAGMMIAAQPASGSANGTAPTPLLATLADGSYQFCSQPEPSDWHVGAGVCFNFAKQSDRIDGYYGYPHSDNFICIRGTVNGNLISGEALAISWVGNQWEHIPESAFTWDLEQHLTLNQVTIVRNVNEAGEKTDWILFHRALLNLDGFYQYSTPRMRAAAELCHWNIP